MATTLHRARQNFAYQLEQISPTSTIVGRGFLVVDELRLDAAGSNAVGHARDFTIAWEGSRQDAEPTDGYLREAVHGYELRISYPTALGTEGAIMDAIAQDRHDVIERLRPQAYFTGYAGDASGATGLMRRTRTRDYLIKDGPVWVHVYEFECLVYEAV